MKIRDLVPGGVTLICILALSMSACDSAEVVNKTPEDAATETNLGSADTTVQELSATPDVLAEEFGQELAFEDAGTDGGTGLGCEPGEGCFLDKCTENDQCQSGWCVEHMGEGVCSQNCQDECPPGWSCQQVAGTVPDVVYICVSDHGNLCRPCASGDACKSLGGSEDVCVAYGSQGSFCGGACTAGQECPWGFSCIDALTVDGIATKQCVADAGVCPCTTRSVELALWTSCAVSNESGTCDGKRICAPAGLSDCDALEPAAETCNGVDDDCDGFTDEPAEVGGNFVNLCHDDNDCTEDVCEGEGGCEHAALTEGECKDGNPCTIADHCVAGVCVGDPVDCDDKNPCTDNLCTESGGCEYVANDASCDDGDPCTVGDHCKGGECASVAMPCDCLEDSDCEALEDGDACNGELYCDVAEVPYKCSVAPETVVVCPAPEGATAICLQASCDPATGACALVPDHEGFACEDGDLCTVGDTCVGGGCQSGAGANCSDGNPCTDDICSPETGCLHEANNDPCQDESVCTVGDLCAAGECLAGEQVNCQDANSCTDDTCDPTLGCLHTPGNGACDDGNKCTSGDHCAAGKCVFDSVEQCDDENPCTIDSCDPGSGCVYELGTGPCDDGDVCTLGDHCHLGDCISSATLSCGDGNPCTDDACVSDIGCTHTANDALCDLDNDCTKDDHCQGGICVPGALVGCDDGNVCTDDWCDPTSGCLHGANSAPCDNGDACTVMDTCVDEACEPGMTLNCIDGNPCTDDSCTPDSGCVYINNSAACEDGSVCTQNDSCVAGACAGGQFQDCSDGAFCNGEEQCDPLTGCVLGTPPNTNDGVECTLDVCDEDADEVLHMLDHDFCATGGLCRDDYCDPQAGCISDLMLDCCGNEIVEAGEECDLGAGNADVADVCRTDCKLPTCPDGIIDAGETCDDGNTNNGDDCKNDCTVQDLVEHSDGFHVFYNSHAVDVYSSARAIDACEFYWNMPCKIGSCGGAHYTVGNHEVDCNNGATQRIWYFGTEGSGYVGGSADYAGWTIHPPNVSGKVAWW